MNQKSKNEVVWNLKGTTVVFSVSDLIWVQLEPLWKKRVSVFLNFTDCGSTRTSDHEGPPPGSGVDC